MEAEHLRLLALCTKFVSHYARPNASCCAELSYFFQNCGARNKEEGEARGKFIDLESGRQCSANVFDSVCQCESYFLRWCSTGLRHVISGDGNGVPLWKIRLAVLEDVCDEANRFAWRINVCPARYVLLEHIILNGALEVCRCDPLFLSSDLIQKQKNAGRCINGHAGGNFTQRNSGEEFAHVVEGINRYSDFADFTLGQRCVRIHSHLSGQIESHG
ncbi:unannotated protein [freshwater metagenome]|uniref:Unannotated protein n=1 Tax=freshwater metagenome TaxID=449393 RepID=A0A6J6NWZ9_9ZZZZ